MRRRLAVDRLDRPLVVHRVDLRRALVDHRLDADRHALLETVEGAGLAEVRDVRGLVDPLPDTVPHQLAHDAVTVPLAVPLDRRGDVPDPIAHARLGDALHERLLGDRHQALHVAGDLAHGVGPRAVRVPAILLHPEVEVDDVALLEGNRVRDAVDDHVVDRDARRSREVAVVEEAGPSARLADEPLGELVELVRGRLAGDDGALALVERPGDDPPANAHLLDLFFGLLECHSSFFNSGFWICDFGNPKSKT